MMPLPAVARRDRIAAGQAAFTLVPGAGHPAFAGHFPGDPVLPGVVQVDWAVRLAREAFGPLGGFRGLDQAKFLRPARPGEALELRLALDRGADALRLRFQYQGPAGRVSSGTVRFQLPL
jgi:3-hydroxymyristoyl/3-hydroxydecanoyl-(acyl carrier protein) dehydratase